MNWNGGPIPSQRKCQASHLGIVRKLKEVGQFMWPMMTRNDLADFLNNPENAQGLNVLVEDIRYALMDYQVCTPKQLTLVISNPCFRLHYDKTSMTRAAKRL